MGLTFGYSLAASLVVALTVVPAMASKIISGINAVPLDNASAALTATSAETIKSSGNAGG